MIASRRGVLVLAAVAVLLAIVVAIDLARSPSGPPDRALVPGLDPEQVTSLAWERGGERVVVERSPSWRLAAPVDAPADANAVSNALAALRSARWHRRAEAAAAGTTTATLTITTPSSTRIFRAGAELAGSEQQWLVAADRALLVDRWVVRALFPPTLALVDARPFDPLADATPIELVDEAGSVRITGHPRRAAGVLLAAELVAALEDALANLEIVSLAPSATAPTGLGIRVGDRTATLGGACDRGGTRLAVGALAGCVTSEAATAVRDVLAKLRRPPPMLVEQRPVPYEVASIVLLDGSVLDVTKQLEIDGTPADPARVAELLAVLAAPAAIAITPASGGDPIRVTGRDGSTLVLELVSPNLVHRQGEPVTLAVTPEAWAILARKKPDLRDPTLWIEDPLAIEALTIADATYARGAVVGEWTRDGTPVSASVAARVDALATSLATLRALSPAPSTRTSATPVTLRLRDPGGGTRERTLGVGAVTRGSCPVTVGADRFYGARAICETVAALLR